MVVGIKYCGGCNPNYERRSVVKRAQAEFPDVRFIPYDSEATFDLIAVVCGCLEECFTFSCPNSKHGAVWVRSYGEYARLQKAVLSLKSKNVQASSKKSSES